MEIGIVPGAQIYLVRIGDEVFNLSNITKAAKRPGGQVLLFFGKFDAKEPHYGETGETVVSVTGLLAEKIWKWVEGQPLLS